MTSDAERALWAFDEAVQEVRSFVRGASYGLRLAVSRIGGLKSSSPGLGEAVARVDEMERLLESLSRGEDHLSDAAILALGDHFRAFLARALHLESLPALPGTRPGVENISGTPHALDRVPFWFSLALQLYRAALQGGRLDRAALDALGGTDVELAYPGGKRKLFREGDRITLTEGQLDQVADAYLEAAKAIKLKLLTA